MKVDVHTELFEFLDEYKRREDPELRFTLRKSNVGNKLERGYWFFGNEKFLAVSFWTGVNWQTKLPNISLIIRESDEVNYTISLDVTMSEEESGKYDILRDHIVPLLEFDKIREDGAIERFRYIVGEGRSIESILSDFLENEKKAIDDVVLKNHGSYFSKSIIERDKIGFINEYEFSNSRAKIFKHLEHRKAQRDYELTEGLNKDRGTYISSFVVNNFANFQHIEFRNLPMNNRWIFITGENGSGKTNLLKAIALVLGYGLIPKDYFQEGRTSFEADLVRNDNTIKHYKRAENSRDAKYAKRPLVHGFAAYGVFRLSLWKRYDTSGSNPAEEHLSKKGRLDSLFARTPRGLIELPRILKYWYSDIEKFNRFMDREYLIVQVLCEVVPGLVDVHFNKERNVVKADYFIRYDEDENVSKLTYDQLSSGTKSTLSFVSDIIIRFYDQQPKVEDPAKFRGIVLVDEIDLHLHP
ncbi:MAG: AAA family ATPase, partial [Cyclobacteriaceae bacterium]